MKLIINIPEDRYNLLKRVKEDKRSEFEDYAFYGIPLSKFANELIESIEHIGGNEKNALRLNLNPSYATGLERAVAKIKEFFTNVEVSEDEVGD